MFLAVAQYTRNDDYVLILDTNDCTIELVYQAELTQQLVQDLDIRNIDYTYSTVKFRAFMVSMLNAVHWGWFDTGRITYELGKNKLVYNGRELYAESTQYGFTVNGVVVSRYVNGVLQYLFMYGDLLILRCSWSNYKSNGLFTVVIDSEDNIESYENHDYSVLEHNKDKIAKMEVLGCL